ncbi:MAG: crossover junction endodeoxyribonuclease RuvC [Anaerolineae bacterium]
MLSLGVDPGTATVGYGFVREHPDGTLEAIAYGVISTPPSMPMHERLSQIYRELTALIELHKPEAAAVEAMFFGKNITTAITVAQGRGVILLALAHAKLPIREYKPAEIKQTVAGFGAAKKDQVQEMVKMLLGLESIPRPDDAADGLAIAITDLHNSRYSAYMD